jgi:N-methylhydantoinase A
VLGLIDAENFLGGDMSLDKAACDAAMARLGEALDGLPVQAARGIYRIVTEAMASAARTHATDRGVDYRGLPLFAFGGAGPLHACGVADLLQSTSVIVPPQSSVLSAFGTLVTPVRLDLVRSDLTLVAHLDWERVDRVLGDLESEGMAALGESGCAPRRHDPGRRRHALCRPAARGHVIFETDPRQSRDAGALAAAVRGGLPHALRRQSLACPDRDRDLARRRARPLAAFRRPGQAPDRAAGSPSAIAPSMPGRTTSPSRSMSAPRSPPARPSQAPPSSRSARPRPRFPPGWSATIDALGCIVATKG